MLKIIFLSLFINSLQVDSTGFETTVLEKGYVIPYHPKFSPNDSFLAYIRFNWRESELVIYDINKKEKRIVCKKALGDKAKDPIDIIMEQHSLLDLSWSPDGKQIIACLDFYSLDLIDLNTKKVKTLVRDTLSILGFERSPDGQRLIFFVGYYESDIGFFNAFVWMLPLDSKKAYKLFNKPVFFSKYKGVCWSPTGDKIALFVSEKEWGSIDETLKIPYGLYITGIDSNNLSPLFVIPPFLLTPKDSFWSMTDNLYDNLEWSSDSVISYTRSWPCNNGNCKERWMIKPDGKDNKKIDTNEEDKIPIVVFSDSLEKVIDIEWRQHTIAYKNYNAYVNARIDNIWTSDHKLIALSACSAIQGNKYQNPEEALSFYAGYLFLAKVPESKRYASVEKLGNNQ